MNKLFKYAVALAVTAILIPAVPAKADEGMWMVHAINKALEKNMRQRGLKLKANQIYDADAPGATLADAVVSMAFGCTGSIISPEGLLITNHHCAYGDVYDLSMGKFGNAAEKKNYLEEGFWAMRSDEEVSVPGKKVYFLKEVMDVTDIVKKRQEEAKMEGKPLGMRKLSYQMEQEYSKDGLEAMLYSMWSGSVYYIVLYKVYSDVRLVAAPPVSISAYGGDIDNWEWPQHKCDFAMYRVYTAPDGSPAEFSEENVPMQASKWLKISTKGVKEGDYAMVMGYPGRTNRYDSSYEIAFKEEVTLPVTNQIRGEQMELLKNRMASDKELSLIYSDYFFSMSNIQELGEGEQKCFARFGSAKEKAQLEKELQGWIDSDPERKAKWGNLLSDLKRGYELTKEHERNITWYRETVVRGGFFSRVISRASNAKSFDDARKVLLREREAYRLDVERELFINAIVQYYENVADEYLGSYQKSLLASSTPAEIAAQAWDNSFLTSAERAEAFFASPVENEKAALAADPLIRFCSDVKIVHYNEKKAQIENLPDISALEKEYTHALYQMRLDKGIPQYPDANSSMRITYGTVGGYEPYDAVMASWKSTAEGILQKYDPKSYDFNLDDKQKALLEANRSMTVNFLTDNDITGGNSGSPVMNGKGELIGLAFDGNKESLASDADFVDGYNKCVCVDIRYVLFILEHYAGMERVLKEMEVAK